MPATGDMDWERLVTLALQGLAGGGVVGLGGLLFGVWDRRMKGRSDNRGDDRADDQALNAERQRLVENLRTEGDRAATRAREAEKRLDECEEDRDLGWDLARGMETLAHERRHAHLNVVSALIALRAMVKGFLAGAVTQERLRQALDESADPVPPPPVPPLRDVEPRKAGAGE
ncbi:hypothetical protein [Roseomonas elaeocarpi]|uniref:Secreted protein n=1 Tax=Roseomonas elaeocarpi TaxID=907779 RepID=A0ABV6JUM4_9PROT